MQALRTLSFLVFAIALVLATMMGCSSAQQEEHEIQMAPLHTMPHEVQTARVAVQQAYQFAVANPELMTELPCYCGCGPLGHTSNYDCYVADVDASGAITFDAHALGCTICVDITQDAMRMMKQGHDPGGILAYINQTYAKYGPSNMP
jgi:hypothetical protein